MRSHRTDCPSTVRETRRAPFLTLGISPELVHDLSRTGQLGSVKAGRCRLIAEQHLEAFLAGETLGNN
jgi:hypothetical protein